MIAATDNCVVTYPRQEQSSNSVRAHTLAGVVATSHPPTILWVDDNLTTLETGGQLLALAGFNVDFATTGGEGIALACSRQYDGILLDLGLPDGSGIDVLQTLRERGLSVAVTVVSGYGSVQHAVSAAKLKIVEFCEKPLGGDELVAVARRLAPPAVSDRSAVDLRALLMRIDDVLESLPVSHPSGGHPLVPVLVEALLTPGLSMADFLVVCRAFRSTRLTTAPSALTAAYSVQRILREAVEMLPARSGPRLRRVLDSLEAEANAGSLGAIVGTSSAMRLSARELGLLIRRASNSTFRQWRTASRVRPAIVPLASTLEHVAQVAYRLGYTHPTQLNRDFRRLLGTNPTDFRQLLA